MNASTLKPRPAMALAFGLIAFIIAAVIALRPADGNVDTGISREKFWWLKVHADPVYDLVIGGDSRVMIDVDPAVIEQETGIRAFNFGFNFAGYSQAYLDALAAKLHGGKGAILLGITPRSLTPLNMRVSTFEEESKRSAYEQFQQQHMSGFFEATRPFQISAVIAQLRGQQFLRNHYANGFMSLELVPPIPDQDLPTYKKVFKNNAVSQLHIDALIARTAVWRSSGIRVFGFSPPVSPAIAEAEKQSGFDLASFIARFEAAGGRWIVNGRSDYLLADGSHLSASETSQYSRELAAGIAEKP